MSQPAPPPPSPTDGLLGQAVAILLLVGLLNVTYFGWQLLSLPESVDREIERIRADDPAGVFDQLTPEMVGEMRDQRVAFIRKVAWPTLAAGALMTALALVLRRARGSAAPAGTTQPPDYRPVRECGTGTVACACR